MKILNDKERYEILSLKPDDITQKKLVELFAATNKGESRYEPNDKFTLDANALGGKLYNKTAIETTVGRFILNIFTLPESYLKKHGYNNETLNSKNLGKQETNMADMMLLKELKAEDYLVYMQKIE